MRAGTRAAPDVAAWEESLLGMETEKLLAIARNYVGPVKSPWDKRTVAGRLASFARKAETVEAIVDLLDSLDVAIACTILLAGPLSEGELRGLFHAEVGAFDLGVKVANLEDRLVLFRLRDARLERYAVNPLLSAALAPLAGDARIVLGGGKLKRPDAWDVVAAGTGAEAQSARSPILLAALGLFAFLFHNPGSVRKDGTLSKKAASRLSDCVPETATAPDRYGALLLAFVESGILARSERDGDFEADATAFGELLANRGSMLPVRLALALSSGRGEGGDSAEVLEAALEALPRGVDLPETGLARWLGIAAIGAEAVLDSEAIAAALSRLCIIERRRGSFVVAQDETVAGTDSRILPAIVADGAHLIRVLPEADVEARWFAARIARPVRLGLVWELELDRDSLREAFAAGLAAKGIVAELSRLGARPLPQSIAFSIESWEGEFLSTRLFHGWVLVCDERRRAIVEGRPDLLSFVRERLAPGVYLLDASDHEEISSRLSNAGIEVPPPIRPHGHGHQPTERPDTPPSRPEGVPHPFGSTGSEGLAGVETALGAIAGASAPLPVFDPEPRLSVLRTSLAARVARAAEAGDDAVARARARDRARELADRIEFRLVLDEAQLDRADFTPVRTEAGGIDYGGKTRLAERAIASRGDRLEIKYQLPGGDPETVVVRPVRLQKTERGLVLEGENLAAGTPVRVPLGAASMVRRLRATPFGDER